MGAPRNLLVAGKKDGNDSGTIMEVSRERSGFDYVTFEVRRLKAGEIFEAATDSKGLAIVTLGGRFRVSSSQGNWESIGGRPNVFSGKAWTLYLPVKTSFTITALTDCELAFCYCRAEDVHPAALIP